MELEWKASNDYGSFYAIDEGTIFYAPMFIDGTMDFEQVGEVDERAFSLEEEQPFIDEMVRLFGGDVLLAYPIKYFNCYKIF